MVYFFVTCSTRLLVGGATSARVFRGAAPFNTGLGFVMTAMFAVIFGAVGKVQAP